MVENVEKEFAEVEKGVGWTLFFQVCVQKTYLRGSCFSFENFPAPPSG